MENIVKDKRRSLTPDVCRGIAIFLVVWGHVIQQGLNGVIDVSENTIFKIIYSFHMPLFMLISGYFFYGSQRRKDFRELVGKKVVLFLRVILIWNTICYVCKVVLEIIWRQAVNISVKGWFEELLQGYWFLWAVLFCTLVVGMACKFFSRRYWIVGCVLLAPFILISPCRWVILSIYPFYLFGFFYGRYEEKRKELPQWLGYVVVGLYLFGMICYMSMPAIGNSELKVLLDVCMAVIKNEVSPNNLMSQLLRVALYYFLGFTGSLTVIIVTKSIIKRMAGWKIIQKTAEIGQYSLQIYILQRIIVELIFGKLLLIMTEMTGENVFCEKIQIFTFAYSLLIAVISLIIVYVIIKYGIRGKIRNILFGR